MESLQNNLGGLIQTGVTWGVRVIGFLVALFVLKIVAGLLANSVKRSLTKRRFDETLTSFFANLVRYAVLAAGIIGCLGIFGIETTSFAAVLAAAGLAIGMALQGTLGNFAAGVMLLVFRPFKIGDFVNAGGQTGSVVEIGLFTTELKTLDARKIVVPNGKIFGDTIENISHHPLRRVDIPVGTAYEADIDTTRRALERCAQIPDVLDQPAPQIFLKALGASSIDWEIRVWTQSEKYWDVHQAIIRAAKTELDQARIGIPFPQMDIHFDGSTLEAFNGQGLSPSERSPTDGPRHHA